MFTVPRTSAIFGQNVHVLQKRPNVVVFVHGFVTLCVLACLWQTEPSFVRHYKFSRTLSFFHRPAEGFNIPPVQLKAASREHDLQWKHKRGTHQRTRIRSNSYRLKQPKAWYARTKCRLVPPSAWYHWSFSRTYWFISRKYRLMSVNLPEFAGTSSKNIGYIFPLKYRIVLVE